MQKQNTLSFILKYLLVLGELKHNIAKLVEDLRFVVKTEKEIDDIIQILDSIVNISKTSIGGIVLYFLLK